MIASESIPKLSSHPFSHFLTSKPSHLGAKQISTDLMTIMATARAKQLRECKITRALQAVKQRKSYCDAAKQFRVPVSTIHYGKTTPLKTPGRKTEISRGQELQIVETLLRSARKGMPLTQQHLREAISCVLSCFSLAERLLLPFKRDEPSDADLRAFRRPHSDEIKFGRLLSQESKRFAAVNLESLSTHFSTIEKLVKDNNIDATRIFNLDEVGISPNKDANGKLACKRIMPRRGNQDFVCPSFKYDERVTMMPVISAAGEDGPPLSVIKGKRLSYRNVVRDGLVYVESPSSCLSRRSVLATRAEGGGVDIEIFLSWAETFIRFTKDLRANGRKVLLVYDGYRPHLSLQVLEEFYKNSVIVYALPAHTSGKTQPLDTVMFSAFKGALNKKVHHCTGFAQDGTIDIFGLCNIIRVGYETAFTRENMKASFRRSGLWPVNASRLLSESRPENGDPGAAIIDVDQLSEMFEEKRKAIRAKILGSDATVLDCGYIDTTNGCVMTSDTVMKLVREKKEQVRKKKKSEEKLRLERELRAAQRQKKLRIECAKLLKAQRLRRARTAGVCVSQFVKQVRSLKERRAIAKRRTLNARRRNDVAR